MSVELENKRLGDITEFKLPVGIRRPDKNYQDIVIDEWRPIDKAKLTSPLFKKNPYAAMTDILRRLVQEIPGLMPRKSDPFSLCSDHYFSTMYQADRDYILVQAVSLSGEVEQTVDVDCPLCGAELQDDVDLDNIRIFYLGDRETYIDVELPKGFQVERDGVMTTFKNVRYHLPTGTTQEEVAKYASDGEFAIANRMLASQLVVKDFGKVPYHMIERMSNKDHKVLLHALGELQPGPDYGVNMHCPKCQGEFTTNLNLQRFLV